MEYSNYKLYNKREVNHIRFNRPLSTLEIYRRVNLGNGFPWYDCNHRSFQSAERKIDILIGNEFVFLKEQGGEILEYKFNSRKEREQWIKCKADELLMVDMDERL